MVFLADQKWIVYTDLGSFPGFKEKTTGKLPGKQMPNTALVLLVMEPEEGRALIEILQSHRFRVLAAHSCGDARKILETDTSVEVIIGGTSYRDGNWCDLLKWLVDHGHRASLVLSVGQADEQLWSEALWRGAYDLLVEPYERSEVCRVIEGAARASSGTSGKVARHH